MNLSVNKDKIIVIDLGSQVTKLIARRIRDYSVLSEVLTLKDLKKKYLFHNVKGIIFSGGPSTVTKSSFPKIPSRIFNLNIPILGICYGLQLIAKLFGGSIKTLKSKREFGRAIILNKKAPTFLNFFIP